MASRNPVGKTALVTGASRGLGRAIAARFLAEGWQVIGTSRDPREAEPLEGVSWVQLDLADRDQRAAAIECGGGVWEKVDVLVNNAGGADFGRAETHDRTAVDRQLSLLLHAPIALTRAMLPFMRERGAGTIINVSSLAVEWPIPYLAYYNAAKAGLSGFSRSLALELRGSGVKVIDFRPGDFRTSFYGSSARFDDEREEEGRVWKAMCANAEQGPLPARAAADLWRALQRGTEGPVRSGGWFQVGFAALAARLLPERARQFWIRRYYGMKG